MAPDGENFRSRRAVQLLQTAKALTLDSLILLGYDRYLAAFDTLLPPLFDAFDQLNQNDSLYKILAEPVAVLKKWDRYASASSLSLPLAIDWAYRLIEYNYQPMTVEQWSRQDTLFSEYARKTPARDQLMLLRNAVRSLEKVDG